MESDFKERMLEIEGLTHLPNMATICVRGDHAWYDGM